MSESSPEPAQTAPRPSKNKNKSKKKSKSQPVTVTDHGKNEGENPHWAYKPPPGAKLFDHAFETETFDWDSVQKDDDLEIWLIRVPDSVKPKYLDGLEIDVPSSSSSRSGQIGSLSRKNAVYDIWSMGDDDTDFAGAEELRGLSCLLPRRKKSGKLYMAPKEIARHLVVSAQPSRASPPEHPSILYQNPPRLSYPKELLKHHFVPCGAGLPAGGDHASMDTDGQVEGGDTASGIGGSPRKTKESKIKESKSRKRKVEGETLRKITVKKPKITE
ncbi:hypothetical protein EDB19DRAFT_147213 [Suillus lakei]|nr:hypothetical protein EDB19DRAFT_147213 [Suillus lakei]